MLLLDQPTQAFYPSEKASQADRNLADMRDDDQEQVHRIFDLILRTVTELDGALQVIILDHAEIPEPWFVEAVGDNNWRHGQALVPSDWY
jgi:predicted O-methyltransferase YrrM